MKKILFLLLCTVASYGQTYQNPTFGTVTTKTNTESATATKINVQETDGKINWLQPVNIPIPLTPTNYLPTATTLGGHLTGIDNKLGTIVATTAGQTTRVWFTADVTVVSATNYYATGPTGKGTLPSAIQSVVNDDNQKKYYTQDVIGAPAVSAVMFPPGVYAGNLSASTTPNSAQQRWTVEIYKCDNNGTPIASGVTGAPVGSLGVTVVTILDSGLLTLADASVTNVQVSGNVGGTGLSVAVGQRIRYHVSAEKVGTAASNITQSVYYGTSYNSYIDVPVPLNTTAVQNLSDVVGPTTTDALNTLNTGKANDANVIHTTGNETKTGNLNVVGKFGVNGILVNDNIGDPPHVWNVTNDSGGLGLDQYLLQATAYANNTGFANVHIRKARGTAAVPLAVLSQDVLSSWGFRGYATTKFASSSAAIQAIAEQNFTDTANGTSLLFEVTNVGSYDSRLQALRLRANAEAQFYNVINTAVKDGIAIKLQSATPTGSSFIRFYDSAGGQQGYIGNFGASNALIIDNYLSTVTINTTGLGVSNLSGTGTRQVVADASGNLSATDVAPTSGTYTPTFTNTLNVTSTALDKVSYMRIGNVVTVTFGLTTNVTAGSTSSQITMTLPVNMTGNGTSKLLGSVVGHEQAGVTYYGGYVQELVSTSTVRVYFYPSASGTNQITGTFTYSL